MKRLILAEKPSVARNIADALDIKGRRDGYMEGEDYVITWVFGHLLQLCDVKDYDPERKGWRMENFPFIPETFQYKIKSADRKRATEDEGAKKQLRIIGELLRREDIGSVISATDYDREGQIIADEIFLYLKTDKPIDRLLLNEWTRDEVLAGLENLKPNTQLQPMQDAGFGRQIADWLIGINLTSVATVKYQNANHNKVLNIGRVLLPTLKILYDRDREIETFQKSKYYKLNALFLTEQGEPIEAVYCEKDSEKFEDRDELEKKRQMLQGKQAKIKKRKWREKRNTLPIFSIYPICRGILPASKRVDFGEGA